MSTQTITKENLGKIAAIACQSWQTKLKGWANRNPFDCSVTLTKSEINEMFSAADSDQVKVLLKYLKREKSIMQKVNSFKDACRELKYTPTGKETALDRLIIMAIALNEGWEADFNNNEEKWFNYYQMVNGKPSFYAVAFHFSGWRSPSALYVKNRELCQHLQKIGDNDYKELLTYNPLKNNSK